MAAWVVRPCELRRLKYLDPTRRERAKRLINEGLAEGSLNPVIGRTFPLDQMVEVQRHLESIHQIGEIAAAV